MSSILPDNTSLADFYTLKRGGVLVQKSNLAIYHRTDKRVIVIRLNLLQGYVNILLTAAFIAYFVFHDPQWTMVMLFLINSPSIVRWVRRHV